MKEGAGSQPCETDEGDREQANGPEARSALGRVAHASVRQRRRRQHEKDRCSADEWNGHECSDGADGREADRGPAAAMVDAVQRAKRILR